MSRGGALLLLGWVVVSGCASSPEAHPLLFTHPFEIPPLSLQQKAAGYDAAIPALFLSEEGLLLYKRLVDADGQPRWYDRGPRYGNLADAAIWGGVLLGAQAFRYAATRDPDALARVRHLTAGLRHLQRVTGQPGLLARSFSQGDDPEVLADAGGTWYSGRPPHGDYLWKGDVSRDQLIGVVFGYTATWLLVDDPEVRRIVAEDATALADHLLRNDLQLVDPDGEVTTHGDLSGFIGGIPIGVNAGITLVTFKLAHTVSQEERFARRYRELLCDGYVDALYWCRFAPFGITNHSNDHMSMLALWALLSLEAEPATRSGIRRGLERLWQAVRRERNSFFTFLYLSVCGGADADRLPWREALDSLYRFPTEMRSVGLDLTGYPGLVPASLPNRGGDPCTVQPLPMNYRGPSSYQWVRCPFALYRSPRNEGGTRYPGVDYLVAYWLGRQAGLIQTGW